jgi:hypothetical protein
MAPTMELANTSEVNEKRLLTLDDPVEGLRRSIAILKCKITSEIKQNM